MLSWSDRLYGRLDLPDSARRLASSCPLLLRLREIRMPNVPFLTFPSFAGVTRYEHSLGVAHLAWWWAKRNGLHETDREAFTLAALYHDAATPALSHLFEEFLSTRGFDHETELSNVLGADSVIPGKEYAQIFLGREPKLRQELNTRAEIGERLSVPGIVRLIRKEDPLGAALQGSIDLDNIDNVIRAASAMGLMHDRSLHPYEVASELIWEDDELHLSSDAGRAISIWHEVRARLYGAILGNKEEFLAQTSLKWAIHKFAENDPDFLNRPQLWTLTEPELLFDHLRRYEPSRVLIDDLRLGRYPRLVATTSITNGYNLVQQGDANPMTRLLARFKETLGHQIFANFYLDKSARPIALPASRQPSLFPSKPPLSEGNGSLPMPAILGIVGENKLNSAQLDEIGTIVDEVIGGRETDITERWPSDRRPLSQKLF